jgi:hypothetical protein
MKKPGAAVVAVAKPKTPEFCLRGKGSDAEPT